MKPILGLIAIALTFAMFVPYLRMTWRGTIRPHAFSWGIWGAGTLIVFVAQLVDGAGAGAWSIGLSGALTCGVAILAWQRRGDTSIVRSDWAFLLLACSALPCWFLTRDPLAAVAILTLVDLLGFGPTLRHAWDRPHEESVGMFGWSALRNALAIAALEHYSLTTVLFPAAVGVACVIVAAILVARRRQCPSPAAA